MITFVMVTCLIVSTSACLRFQIPSRVQVSEVVDRNQVRPRTLRCSPHRVILGKFLCGFIAGQIFLFLMEIINKPSFANFDHSSIFMSINHRLLFEILKAIIFKQHTKDVKQHCIIVT